MPGTFALPLADPQPSQLYLNGRKVALACQWFDFDHPDYDPVPVREVGGEWVVLDGHTRAFLAALAGADALSVAETDEDLPMDVYRECVRWCRDEGVTDVRDLLGRAVNADTFEAEWVARCEAVE